MMLSGFTPIFHDVANLIKSARDKNGGSGHVLGAYIYGVCWRLQGQPLNKSELESELALNRGTIRTYLDELEMLGLIHFDDAGRVYCKSVNIGFTLIAHQTTGDMPTDSAGDQWRHAHQSPNDDFNKSDGHVISLPAPVMGMSPHVGENTTSETPSCHDDDDISNLLTSVSQSVNGAPQKIDLVKLWQIIGLDTDGRMLDIVLDRHKNDIGAVFDVSRLWGIWLDRLETSERLKYRNVHGHMARQILDGREPQIQTTIRDDLMRLEAIA